MARIKPIRLSKSDRAEYQRLVKNTRAKIRRTKKKFGVDLSDEVPLPPLGSFKTREEFNEWKDAQRRFTNRDNWAYQFVKNKYGVVASRKEIRQTELMTEVAQRRAESILRDAQKKPFISGGKEQGTVGQRMWMLGRENAGGVYVPPKFDFDKMQSRSQFQKRKENIEERAKSDFLDRRSETMKENFMKILELSFHSGADELVEELKNIPGRDFFEMYLMFDEFDFRLYDSEGQNVDADEGTVAQMMTYVERYKRGKINMDLRGF